MATEVDAALRRSRLAPATVALALLAGALASVWLHSVPFPPDMICPAVYPGTRPCTDGGRRGAGALATGLLVGSTAVALLALLAGRGRRRAVAWGVVAALAAGCAAVLAAVPSLMGY